MKQFKQTLSKLWGSIRNPVGRTMMACALFMGFVASTGIVKADDISDTTTSVAGYVTAAIAVGVSCLLFVLGRKVLRRLVAVAFILGGAGLMNALFTAQAHATGDDITTVTTSVAGYVTAAIAVGVSVLLFVLGRKVLRRLV